MPANRNGGDRPMPAGGAFNGRDMFAGGACDEAEMGGLIARALGLGPASVLTDASTPADFEAAWTGAGWVQVGRLAPRSDLPFFISIFLTRATIDTGLFAKLASEHGLTLAWTVREDEEHDWHYRVALPDGSSAIRWFHFHETGDSYAVRMIPPLGTADRP